MPIYSAEEYNKKYGHKVERHPLPNDCATSNYPRVIHGEETWMFLQNVFLEHTSARKSYHHRTHARNRNLWYSGLEDDYVEARDELPRGRGNYAIRDISMGTKVWYAEQVWVVNNGYWFDKESMLEFLERLPHDLQCEVLLWAYATDTSYNPSFKTSIQTPLIYVECNLDEASFFNHAERPELVNLSYDSHVTRDIKKGEELLMDYGSFIALGENSIPWYDEIRNRAWKEPEGEDLASDQDSESSSSSSSLALDAEAGIGTDSASDCMADYVKYGVPKTATLSTGVVDAQSVHGAQSPHNGAFSTLAGLYLAWVLSRRFAAMGVRR